MPVHKIMHIFKNILLVCIHIFLLQTCLALKFTQDKFDKLYKPTVGVDFFLKRIMLPGNMFF